MEKKKSNLAENLRKHLESLTDEEVEKINEKYFTDKRPKGWLSIDEHLPMMRAIDIIQGYSLFMVKDKDGNDFWTMVSDHNAWYYKAKDAGITHWFNA